MEAKQDEPQPEEELIAQYLDRGSVLLFCPGVMKDALDPARVIGGGPNLMTDGTRCWYGDLPYYVRRYHVRMDPDFVAEMRERAWMPPDLGHDELIHLEDAWFPEIASSVDTVDIENATWLTERPRGWTA